MWSEKFTLLYHLYHLLSIFRNVQERNDWLDALNSAIEDYRSRKATFVSLDQMASPSRSLGRLGDAAPVWVPDTRVTMCGSCSAEFSLVLRRHHCRACGKVMMMITRQSILGSVFPTK